MAKLCAYDARERVHESQGFNAPSVPQFTALMLAVSAVVVAAVLVELELVVVGQS